MQSSHWLELQHLHWRGNLVKDFFWKINFPPMRALKFITGHVTYNPAYTYKFQLKTTHFCLFYPSLAVTTQACLNSITSSSGAAFRKKATFQLFLSKLLTFWGKLNTPPIHYKAPAFWAPAASQQCVHTPANTVTFYWLSCRLFSAVHGDLPKHIKFLVSDSKLIQIRDVSRIFQKIMGW